MTKCRDEGRAARVAQTAHSRTGVSRLIISTLVLATGNVSTVRGHAQTIGGPAFEVVSVKAAGPGSTPPLPGEKVWGLSRPIRYSGSRVTGSQTLKHLIQYAYSLEDWAVEGPSWFNQELFDFTAVMPPDTSQETAKLMFRRMLAERLGLEFHMVAREVPVYALVEAKQAFQLRPLPEGPEKPSLGYEGRPDRITATGTLNQLAMYFRSYADAPIINTLKTEGIFRVEMNWARYPEVDPRDQFWTELEKRIGLKREKRKLPCDVLVVDHALRTPTPN